MLICHCIEKNASLEQDLRRYLKSFKYTNAHLLSNLYFLQPTNNDISDEMKKDLKGLKFIKDVQYNPQQNTITNYTNIPITCKYFADGFADKNEYMIFSDIDILYFDVLKLPETDKCGVTIFEDMFNLNEKYLLFKDFLPDDYKIDNINGYINTWFIYAHVSHYFWKEYKKLTFILLNILHKNDIDCEEEICEELASSILYNMNPNDFFDISDVLNIAFQENVAIGYKEYKKVDEKTVVYHYNDMQDFKNGISKLSCTQKKIIGKSLSINDIKNSNLLKDLKC
jgi:hypothetical protein